MQNRTLENGKTEEDYIIEEMKRYYNTSEDTYEWILKKAKKAFFNDIALEEE